MIKSTLRLLLFSLMLSTAWSAGASDEDRLITVGLNLFPNIVSIDEDIAEKRADNGHLYLLIAYEHQSIHANKLAEKLRSRITSIKKYPVKVVAVKASELRNFSKRVAGIFLSERLGDELLNQVIDHTREPGALLFSPFPGDVERGVIMGMQITSKIWPYCNTKSMELSGIRFHPSFAKIMRCYGE